MFKKGFDAARGKGKKGRSGRKAVEFVSECERLADKVLLPKLRTKLKESNPDDPAFRWAAETILSYAKSKAPARTELGGAGGGPVVIRVIRD